MNSSLARIGYARVSTADQNLDAQIAALEAAGCTMVRTETGDGATLAVRPELGTILEFTRRSRRRRAERRSSRSPTKTASGTPVPRPTGWSWRSRSTTP